MTRFEKIATVSGLLVGLAGLMIAAYPYWTPPPPPAHALPQREDDPEMKLLMKAVLAKLAQDGKTLEAPPSVSAAVAVPPRVRAATAAPPGVRTAAAVPPRPAPAKAAPSTRAVQPAVAGRQASPVVAKTGPAPAPTRTCRVVTTTYEKDGIRREEARPYCRQADGSWKPSGGSSTDSKDLLRDVKAALMS